MMIGHVKRKTMICKNCKMFLETDKDYYCLMVEKQQANDEVEIDKQFTSRAIPPKCKHWTDFVGKDDIKSTFSTNHVEEREVIEVVCIDNKGLEDHFERGVRYIFKEDTGKNGMIVVENMLGENITTMKGRFKKVDEKETGNL